MPEPKTRPTRASVRAFITRQPGEETRADCRALVAMMERLTGAKAVMWGTSIIGFGSQRLVYADGSGADWPVAAFSPRKRDLTLYLMGVLDRRTDLLARLGRHRTGKVCLYLRRLSDVDQEVLEQLVLASLRHKPAERG